MTNPYYNDPNVPVTASPGRSLTVRAQFSAIAAAFDALSASALVVSEWLTYAPTATFINGTSFSVLGNQTASFHVGRRVKTVNTGGTVYSRIIASVYNGTTLTTVTLVNDSGALDIGLSAVAYGLLSETNWSIPLLTLLMGGTGATTAGGARTNLGAAASGANGDITSLTALQSINGGQVGGFRNRTINAAAMVDQINNFSPIALPANAQTYFGDVVIAAVNGAPTTCGVTNSGGFGTGNPCAFYIAGGVGVTNPSMAFRHRAEDTRDLAGGSIAVQLLVYQTSGSSQTIAGNVYRANAANNFSGVTLEGAVTWQNAVVPSGVNTVLKGTMVLSGSATTGLQLVAGYTGALSSGALYIQHIQLEPGAVCTAFERRDLMDWRRQVRAMVRRDLYSGTGPTTGASGIQVDALFPIGEEMVAAPAVVLNAAGSLSDGVSTYSGTATAFAVTGISPTAIGGIVQSLTAFGAQGRGAKAYNWDLTLTARL